jgi:hypothetical protein
MLPLLSAIRLCSIPISNTRAAMQMVCIYLNLTHQLDSQPDPSARFMANANDFSPLT